MGASTTSSVITVLSIFIAVSSFLPSSEACGIAVYWGQNSNERSLQAACNAVPYNYINIAFLVNFGGGQHPRLNLAGHCEPASGSCRSLSEDIRYCQSLGVKVLLSLGGAVGNYTITSPDDAEVVADYLWLNFLSGNPNGPLGYAALDGIDFAINSPLSALHWDDLATALSTSSTPQRKIYLTAAPQCVYPDANLDAAIKTGLFDYVWVQFYNNPLCDYSGGADNVLRSWNVWKSALPEGSRLSLGLPAAPQAAASGFIPPVYNLVPEIFPVVQNSSNYGGIMLWNRYWDVVSGYTVPIAVIVCDTIRTQQATHAKMVLEN